jgi:hypothetical protein
MLLSSAKKDAYSSTDYLNRKQPNDKDRRTKNCQKKKQPIPKNDQTKRYTKKRITKKD